jgi:N4-gp56 family major capsid protein
MSADTTSTQSNEVMTFYESKFLERSKDLLVHQEGLQKSTRPTGSGKSTIFNRYTALAKATTPLSEGANPSEVALSSTQVTVTLAEYGNIIKLSKLLQLVSIDKDAAEKSELLGQNMGETLDVLTRDALTAGATVSFAGAKTTLTDVASSNTLSATEIRKIRRTLLQNKAQKYANGMFMAKIGPDTEYDLISDSTWVNAHTYKDGDNIYKGYMGNFFGFDFLLTTAPKSEASTATVYSNIFHGANAAGVYDLDGDMPKMYIKTPNEHDTSNALDRFSTMGWGGAFVAKVLVTLWVLNWKSGASA